MQDIGKLKSLIKDFTNQLITGCDRDEEHIYFFGIYLVSTEESMTCFTISILIMLTSVYKRPSH